jgi:enoyl-CoA hydratase/carnithine racemase
MLFPWNFSLASERFIKKIGNRMQRGVKKSRKFWKAIRYRNISEKRMKNEGKLNHISWVLRAEVCIATIARSGQANSFNFDTIQDLEQILEIVESENDVRGFILTGEGERFFCAGADMKLIRELDLLEYSEFLSKGLRMIERIQGCSKPTLAAVNGLSIGGGGEIALACDFVVAAENAKISFPELRLGMVPGWGGAFRLARLVGQAKALEILLTGAELTAQEAKSFGIVNRVIPFEKLLTEAQSLMQTLLRNSPMAIRLTKRIVRSEQDVSVLAGESSEMLASLLTFMSRDGKEGINSIFEKRNPVWSGK